MSTPEEYGLTVEVVEVTPLLAQVWIARNHRHRPVEPKRVRKYARRMAVGEWGLNGKCITFDADGVLLGGQHRLLACIESGCPFTTLVVRGLDPAVVLKQPADDEGAGEQGLADAA